MGTDEDRRDYVEYVIPARRLAGTSEQVVRELDELILALVALRRWITAPKDAAGNAHQ